MNRRQEKIDVAKILLPLYNEWHKSCIADYKSARTQNAAQALISTARRHAHLGIPQNMEAAVGRWTAKQLNKTWKAFEGIVVDG